MKVASLARLGSSVAVLGACALPLGCGDVFTSTTGDGGSGAAGGSTTTTTTTNTGGTTGTGAKGGTGGTAGSSGTTNPGGTGGAPGCQPDTFKDCYNGPEGTAGVGICKQGKSQCIGGVWSDCMGEVTPGTETCEAGPDGALDEDCNGQIDEICSCVGGSTQPCYSGPDGTNGVGVCQGGTQTCVNNAWGPCVGEVKPSDEICDQKDNDCDGSTDTFADTVCFAEFALGECQNGSLHCDPSGPDPICLAGDKVTETCDTKDNNCDGVTDNFPTGENASCQNGSACIGKKHCGAGTFYCLMPVEQCLNNIDDNCDGVKDPVLPPYFKESFDSGNPPGWTLDTEWEIGSATASMGAPLSWFDDPGTDTTPTLDNNIAGVVLGGSTTTSLHEPYYLTSPVINLNVAGATYLTFRRWLNSDYPQFMSSTIDVFDGNKWITIFHTPTVAMNGGGVHDSMWTSQVLDVTPYKNASFQFRFGVETMTPGVLPVSSWNIDDIEIVACVPLNVVPGP